MKAVKALWGAFLVVMFMAVAGCASAPPKYVTEVKNNYVVFEPPKETYNKVTRLKPPYSKQYVDATWEEKEKILFDHIGRQDLQIDNLITDRESTNKWVIEQRKKVDKLQKESK